MGNLPTLDTVTREIDLAIQSNKDRFDRLGVRYGILGLSLYNFAAAKFFDSRLHLEAGYHYLQKAFEMLDSGYLSAKLYEEISEMGWYLEHCKRLGFYKEDTNEILNDVDDLLYGIMMDQLKVKNLDPVTGALRYGYYFLHRIESNQKNIDRVVLLIQQIEELSINHERGKYWISKLKPYDDIYLGISHGSASIIQFLTFAASKGIDADISLTLRKASDYILNNQLAGYPLFFPVSLVDQITNNIFPHNWCYGDLGTVYGLNTAGRYLNDLTLQEKSNKLFENIIDRNLTSPYLIAGPSLLYGYAGIAMVYQNMGDKLNGLSFKKEHAKLVQHLIALYNPDDQFLGYKGYWNQGESVINYTLSEGLIGISLLLFASKDQSFRYYYEPLFHLSE